MKSELLTKLSCGKSLSECPEKLNEKTPIFKKSSSASINFMKTNNLSLSLTKIKCKTPLKFQQLKELGINSDAFPDDFLEEYQFINKINEGMQGRVFLIKENQTNIYLAAKIYETNDGEAIALIKNEAKILSLLTHPNIIQFKKFYCLENEGLFIIITEYFPSISLETHITLQDLSTIQRTSIVKMIVDVVAYLQENDITHGDFNLSNILINPETSQIKIIDFGLSKHRIFAVEFLSPKGFFFYRPPLQLQIFYQSDIYDVWGLMLVLMGVFLGRKICSNSLMKSFQELEEKSELNDHILWIIQCVRRMLSDQNTVEMMKQSFCQLKEYI